MEWRPRSKKLNIQRSALNVEMVVQETPELFSFQIEFESRIKKRLVYGHIVFQRRVSKQLLPSFALISS